eukprot:scaffold416_cov329-Pavlova_lutheri.AAC.3
MMSKIRYPGKDAFPVPRDAAVPGKESREIEGGGLGGGDSKQGRAVPWEGSGGNRWYGVAVEMDGMGERTG